MEKQLKELKSNLKKFDNEETLSKMSDEQLEKLSDFLDDLMDF